MDHMKVLKRAWETTWRYRALWIFGIILALTTAGARGSSGGGGGGGGGGGNGGVRPPGDLPWPPGRFAWPEIASQVVSTLVVVGIGVACIIVILSIAAVVARYVAETALIRMVDDHEETGERRSVREGFRMGWSRTALRLFLIKLLISLPLAIAFILLFAVAFAPLLLWATDSRVAGVIGTIATVGLFFLILFLLIIVATAVSLLIKFFWRACALDGLGVIESIQQGFDVVRRHLKDVVIMWLIMVGVQIAYAIALIASLVVLFPLIALLIVVGGVLGGLPALVIGGLASLFLEGPVPWILAGVVGIPIFILVVAVPWAFIGGLMEVFKSSTWTLTYRELCVLEGLEREMEIETTAAEELSELDEPGSDSLPESS